MRRHSSWVDGRWSGSVVRMKRSKEQDRRSAMARKLGAIASTKARGVVPLFAAVCWIFNPCSSVPVTKKTS
jgi:hypothetical protein